MKKRIIALICCITMLASCFYVTNMQKVQAAGTEISITDTFVAYWQSGGYVNVAYSGMGSDYTGPSGNFLNDTFVNEYVTFDGGLTYEELKNGLNFFNLATSGIMQFNWSGRGSAFATGAAFTIKQGAPLPYATSAGTAYATLDANYTFTFGAPVGAGQINTVTITKQQSTTFSLNVSGLVANGTSASPQSGTIFFGTDSKVSDYDRAYYEYIQSDATYASYVDFAGIDYTTLASAGVKIRYILDGDTRAIQIEDWGNLRGKLQIGDKIVFHKGLPISYTTTSGVSMKATLDADYIYECIATNTGSHDQVFSGLKYESGKNAFGLTSGEYTTWLQGDSEQVTNVGMSSEISVTGYVDDDLLTESLAADYIDFAGSTLEAAQAMGAVIRFIPTANVLQMGFQPSAVAKLQVGDKIVLKKGLPIIYNSGNDIMDCAHLDEDYTFTLTAKNGTNLTFNCEISGSFSLSTQSFACVDVGAEKYANIYYGDGSFSDATTFSKYWNNTTESVMKDYFEVSGKTYDELVTQGYRLSAFNLEGFQALRFNYDTFDLENGDYVMFKEGLPITYTTTAGKTKTAYLDKDYGYRYNGTQFVYDSTLQSAKEITLTKDTYTYYQSETGKYISNVTYNTDVAIAMDTYSVNVLKDTASAEYIDFLGMTATEIEEAGIELLFIPTANVFQIKWGTSIDWVPDGETISFKKGMPINYQSGGVAASLTLSEDALYLTDKNDTDGTMALVKYIAGGTFGLNKDVFGNGTAAEGAISNIFLAGDALSDAKDQTVVLEQSVAEQYIEFCGLTKEQKEAHGVNFALIRGGSDRVLQVRWGTSKKIVKQGTRIIFKQGMPFTYITTDGSQKTITLDQEYNFVVGEGNTGNTHVMSYTDILIAGTYGLQSGTIYPTGGNASDGYLTNIDLSAGSLERAKDETYIWLDDATIAEYINFCGLNPKEYNVVIGVIRANSDLRVLQIQWGSATAQCEPGSEIVVKKGLPLQYTTSDGTSQEIVTLDADYTFVVQENSTGANGLALSGIKTVNKDTLGDMDADKLLNVNDVKLMRKTLVGLITVADTKADANKDSIVDAKDLVRMKLDHDVAEPEAYTTIFENCYSESQVAAGGTVTCKIAQDIDTKNYIRITMNTTQNLFGTFTYTGDNGTTYTEDFYVEAGKIQFEQFFDNYRTNGKNVVGKTLNTITFKNVGTGSANILLNEVEISDRAFDTSGLIYAQNESGLKIGVDLNLGGSLTYMESLKYDVTEVLEGRDIKIEENYSGTGTRLDEEVNLINVYDLGREIQQSYYADVNSNEYTNATYNNNTWPYNPVQAGDQYNNQSQIIDYRVTDNFIYVKTRAMDWAQRNATTKSYMENWYTLEGNLLYVDNYFVDWNGYEDMGAARSQEVPAMYFAQSLNTFVTDENAVEVRRSNLGPWNNGSGDHYEGGSSTRDWYAWVNDNDFGVGVFMPGEFSYVAGRAQTERTYSIWNWITADKNQNAEDAPILSKGYQTYIELYQKNKNTYQNCFVYNTSYTAQAFTGKMAEYKPINYTYVLTVDKLDTIAATYKTLQESGTILNDSFANWN